MLIRDHPRRAAAEGGRATQGASRPGLKAGPTNRYLRRFFSFLASFRSLRIASKLALWTLERKSP